MKRILALPLAAAALLTLSACTADDAADATPGSTIAGSIFGTQSAERYDQMLKNGRVHDRDGFLLDGENPRYDTLS